MLTPSSEQQAIFDECANGEGNLVIRARAGTGKTTTIIAALAYFLHSMSILLCAFNKKIATELGNRIPVDNAQAKTLHQLGLICIKRYVRNVDVEDVEKDKGRRVKYLVGCVVDESCPEDVFQMICKLCSLGRETMPLAQSGAELVNLALDFECEPDESYQQQGFDVHFVAKKAYEAMLIAAEEPMFIDYSDMIYLPIRNNWTRPMFDVVIVDEAQDMTKAQLMLARGMCRKGGRIIVVGDDCQAIYGFRGADSDALDNLKAELNAKELPLNVTYRCGRSIVAEAQRLVPDYKAAEGNSEGEVLRMGITDAISKIEPGDFVLSRSNAPLVKIAMRLIREGRRARIEGRDIGKGLLGLVKKLGGRNSIPQLLEKLGKWEQRQIERTKKAYGEESPKIQAVADQAETIRVLAEGVSGVAELEQRITTMFSNHDDNGNATHFITCSSIHKAKGLEADRVVILTDTLLSRKPQKEGSKRPPMSPKQAREERNIEYVAITRAKRTLVYASGTL